MRSIIEELFATDVFSDSIMKERLAEDTYRELRKTIDNGERLNIKIANAVASAMKQWAIEKGVTHYTHWFQPMTGITAEKHESFIDISNKGLIMNFNGKNLIKGESDASSFPNGGLRSTFEARGYTAWDPTSMAFIKDKVLYIPTAFCSYGGHALDKKTPLLRSMQSINNQVIRILRLFGNNEVKSVKINVGPEQEYFLVDRDYYKARKDLVYTGRTLFGATCPKGQELDDHYYGSIKPRVKAFMDELNEELWRLGIPAKTEHNEVAPAQFEFAPVFTTLNMATDQNQLTMELIQKIAIKHNLYALLHEKPFKGVNGSGKHNNWSIATDRGVNLLEPGDTPRDNAQFLLLMTAIISAVDKHQDLIRLSVANAGNDHRLGANEAPPAIISIFLGEQLTNILESIEKDLPYDEKGNETMKIKVDVLPKFRKDLTDRNRTSPFAFTGNKFEFRMPGSSSSIAGCNFILNTVIADELMKIADILESAEDFDKTLINIIKNGIKDHKRIIFNGDGYDQNWIKEAERRGLLNLKTTPDVLPYFIKEENIELFSRQNVLSREEIISRYEILTEEYVKHINIEALTMIDMVNKEIFPTVAEFNRRINDGLKLKKELGQSNRYEQDVTKSLSEKTDKAFESMNKLKKYLELLSDKGSDIKACYYIKDTVITEMDNLRRYCDDLEVIVSGDLWPFPTYGKLLFGIM